MKNIFILYLIILPTLIIAGNVHKVENLYVKQTDISEHFFPAKSDTVKPYKGFRFRIGPDIGFSLYNELQSSFTFYRVDPNTHELNWIDTTINKNHCPKSKISSFGLNLDVLYSFNRYITIGAGVNTGYLFYAEIDWQDDYIKLYNYHFMAEQVFRLFKNRYCFFGYSFIYQKEKIVKSGSDRIKTLKDYSYNRYGYEQHGSNSLSINVLAINQLTKFRDMQINMIIKSGICYNYLSYQYYNYMLWRTYNIKQKDLTISFSIGLELKL